MESAFSLGVVAKRLFEAWEAYKSSCACLLLRFLLQVHTTATMTANRRAAAPAIMAIKTGMLSPRTEGLAAFAATVATADGDPFTDTICLEAILVVAGLGAVGIEEAETDVNLVRVGDVDADVLRGLRLLVASSSIACLWSLEVVGSSGGALRCNNRRLCILFTVLFSFGSVTVPSSDVLGLFE